MAIQHLILEIQVKRPESLVDLLPPTTASINTYDNPIKKKIIKK